MYDIRDMGAIFWIVIKVIAWGQSSPSITLGNQKWKGAAPAFNRREAIKKTPAELKDIKKKEAERIIIDDPNAWIRKYLRADSDEYWLFLDEIKGINDKRLSSSPTQAPNQEEEEIDKVVPKSKVNKNKSCGEDSKIKKRGSRGSS